MKFGRYVKDKLIFIILFLFMCFILLMLFKVFKLSKSLILAIFFILFLFQIVIFLAGFLHKKFFYDHILGIIEKLDKSYLAVEMIEAPSFYEEEIVYQILYDISKSMNENVKVFERQMNDFKEYIEMWIHEVKIPISSLELMAHNHKDKFDNKSLEQMRRMENYVEQILYYVRSENAEKDYLIKENSLTTIISDVALRNKDDLLEQNINFQVENVDFKVFTDAKWLEFIINQIINNSIKYKKDGRESYIKIWGEEDDDKVSLLIEDNGIGITQTDLPKVFEKSFTGYNGRGKAKSTGMGLFIAKNLCNKLGHLIEIESVVGEYTKVTITIAKNKYYDIK